jgi:hypothetical protein
MIMEKMRKTILVFAPNGNKPLQQQMIDHVKAHEPEANIFVRTNLSADKNQIEKADAILVLDIDFPRIGLAYESAKIAVFKYRPEDFGGTDNKDGKPYIPIPVKTEDLGAPGAVLTELDPNTGAPAAEPQAPAAAKRTPPGAAKKAKAVK